MKEIGMLFNDEMVRAILDGRKTQTRRISYTPPIASIGDKIYVREAWRDSTIGVQYRASEIGAQRFKWKPSIHMPKSKARIWLEVIGIRWRLLRRISEQDAKAEGITPQGDETYKSAFRRLWIKIYGEESWNTDMVWVITFKRIENARSSD